MPGETTPERAGRAGDQPLPTPGRADVFADLLRTLEAHPGLFDPAAVAVVRPMLVERRALGIRRYGRALETFNGRDAHLDELQEALDRIVYSHQAAMERAELEQELARARAEVERLRAELAGATQGGG